MSRFGVAFLLLFAVIPRVAVAQLTASDRSRLAAEIEAAAENLDPNLFPGLDTSQELLLRRVDALDQYLKRSTSEENYNAWMSYLNLDPITDAVQSPASLAVVGREAVDLRFRLVGTAPGLELAPMQELRDAVEQLIEAIRFRDKNRSAESLSRQLGALAALVRELDENPSAEDFASMSALIGMVESSGQASGLVHSLRTTFNRPNLSLFIGDSFVQTAVKQTVHQTRPVRDCILGTRIVGNATLDGTISARLLPARGAARISMILIGRVNSRNFGYNGGVRLRTVGNADVTISRLVTVNDSGISLEPVQGQAALKTRIRSIEHKSALVRMIARKRAAQQKAQTDRIAATRLRKQVAEQFSSQVDEAVSISRPDLFAGLRPFLERLSLEEPERLWGSTSQAIYIDSVFRRNDQLSSVVSRPAIGESFDAAVQIHESAIDNASAPVLAGRTLNEEELNRLLEQSGRPFPESDDDDSDETEPPFEIDFSRLRPIVFEARGNTLRVGIRGTRFAQGSRELKQSMAITAIYEPGKATDGTAILIRNGDVEVTFPGRKRLRMSEAGLKRTIQKKFSSIFPEQILDRPLEVPSDADFKRLRGQVFRPNLIDVRDGWLTIAVRSLGG